MLVITKWFRSFEQKTLESFPVEVGHGTGMRSEFGMNSTSPNNATPVILISQVRVQTFVEQFHSSPLLSPTPRDRSPNQWHFWIPRLLAFWHEIYSSHPLLRRSHLVGSTRPQEPIPNRNTHVQVHNQRKPVKRTRCSFLPRPLPSSTITTKHKKGRGRGFCVEKKNARKGGGVDDR